MIVFNVQFVFTRVKEKIGSSPQAEDRRSDNTIGECSIEPPVFLFVSGGRIVHVLPVKPSHSLGRGKPTSS